MKNIGVLTLPLANNYGGILQTVALYAAIKKCGQNPIWIDKREQISSPKILAAHVLRRLPGHDISHLRSRAKAARQHRDFFTQLMSQSSRPVYNSKQLTQEVKRLTLSSVIVGSDQVWRPEYQGDGSESNYFLNFGDDSLQRVAYAASFGHDDWLYPDKTAHVRRCLKKFSSVSIREKSGRRICSETFGLTDSTVTLDPTLLHEKEFYSELASDSKSGENSIFVYALDKRDTANQIAREVSNRLGAIPILNAAVRDRTFMSIPDWIASIRNSSFVVTDSYHGTLFAILFGKKFITLANVNRGLDRFSTILDLTELETRMVLETPQDRQYDELMEIDYKTAYKALNLARERSYQFLRASM